MHMFVEVQRFAMQKAIQCQGGKQM